MTETERALDWADRLDSGDEPEDMEPTYRDGSLQNECWAEDGYTRRDGSD